MKIYAQSGYHYKDAATIILKEAWHNTEMCDILIVKRKENLSHMGMIITLRDSSDTSYFKEIMLEIFNVFSIDEVLICSGYFQENKPYRDKQNKQKVSSYQVTVDQNSNHESLLTQLNGIDKITTVGIKGDFGSDWDKSYRNFVQNLRDNLGPNVVKAYADKSGSWHAKEMIMLYQGHAVAGIIGSSNFTKPAYGSFKDQSYNIEADTVIYKSDGDKKMSRLVSVLREDGGEDSFLIVAPYDAKLNGGDEVDLLDKQYRKVMNMIVDPDKFDMF